MGIVLGNNEEISEKYLGNKREKPGTVHRSIVVLTDTESVAINTGLLFHIKTHLWDLSTNLSKLNIVLNLKNIVLYES